MAGTVAEQVEEIRAQIKVHEDLIVGLEAMIEELLRPPAPPPPLPSYISHGADKIPVPGNLNVHVAMPGGIWSDPATWSTGKVPGPTDRVRIQAGSLVLLDGDCVCDTLVVDGPCFVGPLSGPVTLTCTTLFGMPTAQFVCGLEKAPQKDPFTCLFRPAPPDPADPERYWNGIVWLGEFTVHGEPKSSYAELVEDVA